ncbi:MAG TPA: cytochrome P450 [Myxococcota bacterium]|nr:cytochrome P450 [Myxococcota bacterium]
MLADFDPFSPETVEDPYPFYAALRREAPVYRVPRADYFAVSRYEDCRAAALDPRISSNLIAAVFGENTQSASDETPRPVDVLAIADEPAHARQRKLANKAFSLRRVQALEPAVRDLCAELLAPLRCAGGGDFVAAMADELPVQLVCLLVGFPRADRAQLQRWAMDGSALLAELNAPEELARLGKSVLELNRYLAARFAEAQRAPGDDVLGDLVRATREDVEFLTRDEVVAILLQLLAAGSESTNALLGSAVWLLCTHPEVQRRLRAEPAAIPAFVEEVARLESPFQGHFRVAREDVLLAGEKIPAGARMKLLWASANRDERQFSEPTALRIERPELKSHMAFGFGIHHCIGAALARLEVRVALETLLSGSRAVRLAPGEQVRHVPSLMMRRIGRLRIELDA